MSALERPSFQRVMALVAAVPPPPRPQRPTLARSISDPPAYVDYSKKFNVPVLWLDGATKRKGSTMIEEPPKRPEMEHENDPDLAPAPDQNGPPKQRGIGHGRIDIDFAVGPNPGDPKNAA